MNCDRAGACKGNNEPVVVKTTGRKAMQVRVLSAPPLSLTTHSPHHHRDILGRVSVYTAYAVSSRGYIVGGVTFMFPAYS
jgi:hypothetical protein